MTLTALCALVSLALAALAAGTMIGGLLLVVGSLRAHDLDRRRNG
jgi:hypothetical protein